MVSVQVVADLLGCASVDVPKTHRRVTTARHETLAIGTIRHVQNGVRVTRQCIGATRYGTDPKHCQWMVHQNERFFR